MLYALFSFVVVIIVYYFFFKLIFGAKGSSGTVRRTGSGLFSFLLEAIKFVFKLIANFFRFLYRIFIYNPYR